MTLYGPQPVHTMTHCTVEVIGTANKKKKENLVGGQYINKTIILAQSKKN